MKIPATFVFGDGETTHLDPAIGGLLEFAVMHPASGERAAWQIDPRWSGATPCVFDASALRVNGLTREALNSSERISLEEFARELAMWIERVVPGRRAVLVGRNPSFDASFIEAVAARVESANGAFLRLCFHHRKLDTHGALLALACARDWDVDVDKIDKLYERLGLAPEPKPHTAMGGVEHCVRGFELIVREIANGGRAE